MRENTCMGRNIKLCLAWLAWDTGLPGSSHVQPPQRVRILQSWQEFRPHPQKCGPCGADGFLTVPFRGWVVFHSSCSSWRSQGEALASPESTAMNVTLPFPSTSYLSISMQTPIKLPSTCLRGMTNRKLNFCRRQEGRCEPGVAFPKILHWQWWEPARV